MSLEAETRRRYTGTGATSHLAGAIAQPQRGGSMKHLRGMAAPVLAAVPVATPANADSPARERELTCSKGPPHALPS